MIPQPKETIGQIAPYVGGKAKGAPGQRIIKLSSNENPLGPSQKAMEAYKSIATNLHRYPDPSCTLLRETIGKVYKVKPDNIVCGAGSDELIHLLLQSYANPGDEILYSAHSFLMYKIYALALGLTPVTAPERNLTMDEGAMLSRITPRTRVVFVTTPNNPTGTYTPRDALHRFHDSIPRNVLLVIDGAYAEYCYQPDYSAGDELVRTYDNVVTLRTFSKIYGMPALRLGWAHAPSHVCETLNRVRGPFNISSPAQAAGIAAVQDSEYVKNAIKHNTLWRAWLSAELDLLDMPVVPSIANFVLAKAGPNALNLIHTLAERGIMVRDVVAYGLPEYIRITVGTEEENQILIAALRDILKR